MKKLDPRIKDRKFIFDCFNAEEAKKYIGQKCYMSDFIGRFDDIENTVECTLENIDSSRFVYNNLWFAFCLPAEFVAPKEKKLRPYTFKEFCEKFPVGLPIKFREKGDVGNELYLILNGYTLHKENIPFIYIGPLTYDLDELFNKYEFQTHYTEDFEPFGVEE